MSLPIQFFWLHVALGAGSLATVACAPRSSDSGDGDGLPSGSLDDEESTAPSQDETSTPDHPSSDDDDDDDDDGEPDNGSEETLDAKFDLMVPDFADQGDDSECPCEEGTDLIYTLDDSQSIWVYDPGKNEFNELGTFTCADAPNDSTFSMGIARSGHAWIQLQPSRKIFKIDTKNGNACEASSYDPDPATFGSVGMAFVSESLSYPCDNLHVLTFDDTDWSQGPGVGRLGRFDEASGKVTNLGAIDYNGGELTGTADGRLFAFAGQNPAKLIEYDKSNATVSKTTPLDGLELTYAFAFAFWGGDFYFFTENLSEFPLKSKVTKLDYDGDGKLTTVNEKAPIHVVGAGVSTCAPLLPPK